MDDKRKNHRPNSLRLNGYDYASAGHYFITVCTRHRRPLFGHISAGHMEHTLFGRIVAECWHQLPQHYPHVHLDAFVIMPNHIHGILILTNNGETPSTERHGLSEIVRALKSFSARKINQKRGQKGVSVWQRNFYDHIIRNERALAALREYIAHNPHRWVEDQLHPEAPSNRFNQV